MKSGNLAKRLQVHPNTIREWSNQYARYLSEGATAKRREYTETDALVLATIADLRGQGLNHEQIVQALNNGSRVESVPDIPPPEVENAQRRVELVPRERVQYLEDLAAFLRTEIASRESRIANLEDELRAERDKHQDEQHRVQEELLQAHEELGELRGKLATIESERRPALFWLAVIVVLVVIVAVVVFLLARGGV